MGRIEERHQSIYRVSVHENHGQFFEEVCRHSSLVVPKGGVFLSRETILQLEAVQPIHSWQQHFCWGLNWLILDEL
jgi:hypothetical protein